MCECVCVCVGGCVCVCVGGGVWVVGQICMHECSSRRLIGVLAGPNTLFTKVLPNTSEPPRPIARY